MLHAIKTFFHPPGIIQLPSALYIVHLKALPGGVTEPVVWSLPGSVGERGLAAGVRVWLTSGRRWRPRRLTAAVTATVLRAGQCPLAHPLPAKGAAEEVHWLIQQQLNLMDELHIDYALTETPTATLLNYYAIPAREVEAIRATYRGVGVHLAGLEWDVLAMRRAFVEAAGELAHQPLVALLWVGSCSAMFGLFTQTAVMFHASWQPYQTAFETWLTSLLETTRAAGLSQWQVCCAVPSQLSLILQVGQSFGVAVSFLNLNTVSTNPTVLAEALLAWGLALRGVPC